MSVLPAGRHGVIVRTTLNLIQSISCDKQIAADIVLCEWTFNSCTISRHWCINCKTSGYQYDTVLRLCLRFISEEYIESCHRFIPSSTNHSGWLASFVCVCSSMVVGGSPLGPLTIISIFCTESWIFPKTWGRQSLLGAKFSQKIHENEKNRPKEWSSSLAPSLDWLT